MGCLLELLFQIIFEVVLEGAAAIYVKLMSLFVPDHKFSPRLRERIKSGVTVFAALLFLCALLGLFFYTIPTSPSKTVGAYMLFVPLVIIGVQIIAGIIYRIVLAIRKKK